MPVGLVTYRVSLLGTFALLAGLCLNGCARGPRASMEQLFSRGPTGSEADVLEAAEPESTVSANTATTVVTLEDAAPVTITEPLLDSAGIQSEPVADTSVMPGQSRVTVEPRPEREKPGPKIWDRRTVSAAAENTVSRLRKALSTDGDANLAVGDLQNREHPVRVRVDGLVHEAEELLESGEIHDAKVLAERAVELAGAVGLNYLPTEERPEDLLQKIVAGIDERDRAPVVNVDGTPLPVLTLPPAEAEAKRTELTPAIVETARTEIVFGAVAANRPALLSAPSVGVESSDGGLVVMGPISNDLTEPPVPVDPVTAVGLAAPSATGTRLRMDRDAGPLLTAAESQPVPPQIADVAPLPAYSTVVAPRPTTLATDAPKFTFIFADLWPLWGLAIVIAVVGAMLAARRWLTGH
ncbi:MAG TPA: hypothetical protein VFG20_14325 [Planctomycetaceae bacterium]|nr:hypothetical protein [Planctomycetaceae bacterium]